MTDVKRLLEPCIETRWAKNSQGYGTGTHGGRKWRAHRLVWTVINGPIPPNKVVMHTCDNPSCVRLSHLRLGTQADNVADCAAKGRRSLAPRPVPRGESHTRARLSENDVRMIRQRAADGEGVRALAREYQIDPTQISRIVRRERWAHV